MSTPQYDTPELPAVFPDWSPYRDLDAACRAYLRDPEVALEALDGVLRRRERSGFTLERFVTEGGAVWQEVAVCDADRLVLWHGEDLPVTEDGVSPAMTSSVRVVPMSSVTEVGCRRRLVRAPDGRLRVAGVDVYLLLGSLDDAPVPAAGDDPHPVLRQDALRFGKTLQDDGPGQIARVEEFARLAAAQVGRCEPG